MLNEKRQKKFNAKMEPRLAQLKEEIIKECMKQFESKLSISFDETSNSITIETPAGNSIVLNDEDQSIAIKDQHSNKILMDKNGISIDSQRDIKLSAKGDVSIQGMRIENNAQMEFSAKGNASTKLTSSGNTTIAGTMVMIN